VVLPIPGEHTGEHRGFKQLHQFVDLDEHIDSHFELGTEIPGQNNPSVEITCWVLTKFEGDYRLVHKPEQGDTEKRWKQRCGTTTGKGQRKTVDPPMKRQLLLEPNLHQKNRTVEFKFLKRFLISDSSGAVIRLLFKFCTMMLANSMSFKTSV
jgi:hypothetical protein